MGRAAPEGPGSGALNARVPRTPPRPVMSPIRPGRPGHTVVSAHRKEPHAFAPHRRRRHVRRCSADHLLERRRLCARVFSRRHDGLVLHFRRDGSAIRYSATGSRWSASTGHAVAGALAGGRCSRFRSPIPTGLPGTPSTRAHCRERLRRRRSVDACVRKIPYSRGCSQHGS